VLIDEVGEHHAIAADGRAEAPRQARSSIIGASMSSRPGTGRKSHSTMQIRASVARRSDAGVFLPYHAEAIMTLHKVTIADSGIVALPSSTTTT